ncbi:hypothetical protein DPMN_110508 [Dreissena polymorpha]|uniref:Uncharacterized protein n=1 Tax=Dreissena polymorpha TaxID=45954 RepID=A0A9D4KCQ3_DREPO|nr:hypothetical protein DPMN_110508 [Dreissena polymorpha]
MASQSIGKYALLTILQVRETKRKRRATSSSSTKGSAHPSQGDFSVHGTVKSTREQASEINIKHKLTFLFYMIYSNNSLNHKFECLNQKFVRSQPFHNITEARLKLLEYKSIDMEARSLRTNLIFSGHPESESGGNEDPLQIIIDFINNKLNMDSARVGNAEDRRKGRRHVARSQGLPR